jgi:peroxiredoxin
MSTTQDPTESTQTADDTLDPEWQAFYAQVDNAWHEMAAYFRWPQSADDDVEDGEDEEDDTDGSEADEATGQETGDGDAVINSIDSPLNPAIKHSAAFFDLYLARRPDDLANEAARTAFSMFFNCPDSIGRADAAAAQIGDDLDALAAIAPTYVSIYRMKRDETAGDALAERLLDTLNTDAQRSGLIFDMAENWMWSGRYDRARPACERIIAMNADEHHVKRARGMIYEMDNLNVGQIAPTFSAPSLDGGEVNLLDLRGKAVLLDFWATWCGPCIGEFPHLRRVHEKFADNDLMMVSISLDDDCDAAQRKIASERLAWTHVCEGWSESKIAQLYNVMGIPSTWLIAPNGTIAAKDLRGHDLDKAIGELLGRAPSD